MTTDQRRSWLVATALFLMLVLSYSSTYLTMGIFFTPLIKHFGYSHAKVSELSTVAFLTTALFSWPARWLLERIDARFLISAGAVVIAAGLMTASQATHFGPLIATYAIMGAGVGLGTVIPAMIVHLAPFMIKLGYSANLAATALSAFQISAGVSKLSLGALADRSGVKISIAIAFLGGAVGAMSLVASRQPSLLIIGILGMGMSLAPASLIPLLLADAMGLRRFATLQGLQGFVLFLAVAAGPFIQGWLYDLSGSYVTSFHILAIVALVGALLILTCKRYQREQGAELTAPLAPGR